MSVRCHFSKSLKSDSPKDGFVPSRLRIHAEDCLKGKLPLSQLAQDLSCPFMSRNHLYCLPKLTFYQTLLLNLIISLISESQIETNIKHYIKKLYFGGKFLKRNLKIASRNYHINIYRQISLVICSIRLITSGR